MTKQIQLVGGNFRKIIAGNRFKLARDVDRFPDFIARAGFTGTVTTTEGGMWAKMDQHIPDAEKWGNQIHWETAFEFGMDTEATQ